MFIIYGILHFHLARYLYLSAKSAFVNVSLPFPCLCTEAEAWPFSVGKSATNYFYLRSRINVSFFHKIQSISWYTTIQAASPCLSTLPEGSISIRITYANDGFLGPDWLRARALPVLHWVLSSWPRPQATSRFARHFPHLLERESVRSRVTVSFSAVSPSIHPDRRPTELSFESFPGFFTPAGTPTDMNIFRLIGDLSHLAAIIILLLKIWKSRSCAGE